MYVQHNSFEVVSQEGKVFEKKVFTALGSLGYKNYSNAVEEDLRKNGIAFKVTRLRNEWKDIVETTYEVRDEEEAEYMYYTEEERQEIVREFWEYVNTLANNS